MNCIFKIVFFLQLIIDLFVLQCTLKCADPPLLTRQMKKMKGTQKKFQKSHQDLLGLI